MRGNEKKQDDSMVMVISEDILSAWSITCSLIKEKDSKNPRRIWNSSCIPIPLFCDYFTFFPVIADSSKATALQPLCFRNSCFYETVMMILSQFKLSFSSMSYTVKHTRFCFCFRRLKEKVKKTETKLISVAETYIHKTVRSKNEYP